MRYLYSGDVSKMPAELRIAKYSNFSLIWYFSATRCPAQWLHRPVSFSFSTRSWNGVVRITGISPSPTPLRRRPRPDYLLLDARAATKEEVSGRQSPVASLRSVVARFRFDVRRPDSARTSDNYAPTGRAYARCSLLVACCSLLVARCLLLVACCLLLVACCLLLVCSLAPYPALGSVHAPHASRGSPAGDHRRRGRRGAEKGIGGDHRPGCGSRDGDVGRPDPSLLRFDGRCTGVRIRSRCGRGPRSDHLGDGACVGSSRQAESLLRQLRPGRRRSCVPVVARRMVGGRPPTRPPDHVAASQRSLATGTRQGDRRRGGGGLSSRSRTPTDRRGA